MKVGDYFTVKEDLYQQFGVNGPIRLFFKKDHLYRIIEMKGCSVSTRLRERPYTKTIKIYQIITINSENGMRKLRSYKNYMKNFELIEKEDGDVAINFDAFESLHI